jgi:hypothetical protein
VSGLSSGALGGIVAGVFIGVSLCAGIVLVGFCCWNNYRDSRMTSYNPTNNNNQAASTSQTGEDPTQSRLCGRMRGISVVHCLQNGCWCWNEESENGHGQLEDQSSTTMLECVDTINQSNVDANLVAPSVESDVADSNGITDCGVNVTSVSDVTISADINDRSTIPSPSSDVSIVTITDDHGEDVTASGHGETNDIGNITECEMIISSSADVDHPSNNANATNNI